jgi:glyoxylase-like metal-dependent hydrolase (beta-lactamase superfamily II)
LRQLIRRIARENPLWGQERIANELWLKLGLRVSPLRSAEERFVDVYRSQLRPFEKEYEVAPGVVVCRTGGHTLGHSVVRLASGGDRLTFLGDAVFPNHFDHPDWHNAFDHDPRRRSVSGSVFCGSWRRQASCWSALTCRSRPSAGWRS